MEVGWGYSYNQGVCTLMCVFMCVYVCVCVCVCVLPQVKSETAAELSAAHQEEIRKTTEEYQSRTEGQSVLLLLSSPCLPYDLAGSSYLSICSVASSPNVGRIKTERYE